MMTLISVPFTDDKTLEKDKNRLQEYISDVKVNKTLGTVYFLCVNPDLYIEDIALEVVKYYLLLNTTIVINTVCDQELWDNILQVV